MCSLAAFTDHSSMYQRLPAFQKALYRATYCLVKTSCLYLLGASRRLVFPPRRRPLVLWRWSTPAWNSQIEVRLCGYTVGTTFWEKLRYTQYNLFSVQIACQTIYIPQVVSHNANYLFKARKQ